MIFFCCLFARLGLEVQCIGRGQNVGCSDHVIQASSVYGMHACWYNPKFIVRIWNRSSGPCKQSRRYIAWPSKLIAGLNHLN